MAQSVVRCHYHIRFAKIVNNPLQSVLSPEPPVHGPREDTRNQKNNQDHKVNAFDLLFIDGSQDIVERALVPQEAAHVVRFKQTN